MSQDLHNEDYIEPIHPLLPLTVDLMEVIQPDLDVS